MSSQDSFVSVKERLRQFESNNNDTFQSYTTKPSRVLSEKKEVLSPTPTTKLQEIKRINTDWENSETVVQERKEVESDFTHTKKNVGILSEISKDSIPEIKTPPPLAVKPNSIQLPPKTVESEKYPFIQSDSNIKATTELFQFSPGKTSIKSETVVSKAFEFKRSNEKPIHPPPPPLPPPASTARISEPSDEGISNNENLGSLPLPPPPPSSINTEEINQNKYFKSSSASAPLVPPPPLTRKEDQLIDNLNLHLPPLPGSLHHSEIAFENKRNISNLHSSDLIAPTATLLPPPPPPSPPLRNAENSNQLVSEFINPSLHPPSEPLKITKNTTHDGPNHSNTETLGPPVPLPPPCVKSAKKANVLIGWVNNSSAEKSSTKATDKEVNQLDGRNNRNPNANPKMPPAVAAPPTLEHVKKSKERDNSLAKIKDNQVKGILQNPQAESIQEQYDDDEDFSNEPWFFNVSKEEASGLMNNATKKGSYLMRPSQDDQYVLMVRKESKDIKKFKIQRHKHGWILGDPSETKKIHENLPSLMTHYKTNGIKFGNAILTLKEPVRKK